MNRLISIILNEPQHPGNIGAAARAMKNMGLTQLILVSPKAFPHPTATHRASGADDVLENAIVVPDLETAVKDVQWLFGTSARQREFPWPQMVPRVAVEKMNQIPRQDKIGILFGPEPSGLSNEALQLCDYHICIPTDSAYASLNLAAAVQVICYEIFQSTYEQPAGSEKDPGFEKATSQEVAAVLTQFEEVAVALDFMDPKHPKKLMPRVKRLLTKAQLEKDEVNILRGLFKQVLRKHFSH